MVRKRDRYTRLRAKRSRPKTPAPKTGWLIAELAELTHTPLRTLRYYAEQRLLRPLEFRGTATRYPRRDLLRLLGILRLRSESRLTLSEIGKRLDALGDLELEAWLRERPLPPAIATLLSAGASNSAIAHPGGNSAAATAAIESPATAAIESGFIETWQRISLAPGLELMVRSDASPEVRRVAHRICADHLQK